MPIFLNNYQSTFYSFIPNYDNGSLLPIVNYGPIQNTLNNNQGDMVVLCLYSSNEPESNYELVGAVEIVNYLGNVYVKVIRNLYGIRTYDSWAYSNVIVTSSLPMVILQKLFDATIYFRDFDFGGPLTGNGAINIQRSRNSSDRVASGDESIVIGNNAKATGINAIAIGYNAEANSNYSLSILGKVESGALNSVAIGYDTLCQGEYTVAVGKSAKAKQNYAIAVGYESEAKEHGVAVGFRAKAEKNAIAIGKLAEARAENSIALGEGAITKYPNSCVFTAYPMLGSYVQFYTDNEVDFNYKNWTLGMGTICSIRTAPVSIGARPYFYPHEFVPGEIVVDYDGVMYRFNQDNPMYLDSFNVSLFSTIQVYINGYLYSMNYNSCFYILFPIKVFLIGYNINDYTGIPFYYVESIYFRSFVTSYIDSPASFRVFILLNNQKFYITNSVTFSFVEKDAVYTIPLLNPRICKKGELRVELDNVPNTGIVQGEFIVNLVILG